jgi:hypothetical protein
MYLDDIKVRCKEQFINDICWAYEQVSTQKFAKGMWMRERGDFRGPRSDVAKRKMISNPVSV